MSATIGKLYTLPNYTKRILGAVAAAGVKIDIVEDFKFRETNRSPEFLAKFPRGKVPAFEGNDGLLLVESTAIARYAASFAPDNKLFGSTKHEDALVNQWVAFADSDISPHVRLLSGFTFGYIPYFKPLDTSSRQNIFTSLEVLDNHLLTRTYLVGQRLTYADIVIASFLDRIFSTIAGSAERAKYPNVIRHFLTIINQPALKPVFGEPQFIEKAQQYVAPPKPAKEKPAPPPPKEKPAPAKPEVQPEEEEEPSVLEEPKPKNPLDSLPKSTLNLEDWKRTYSNLDTKGPGGSLEWFYDKWDPEGYSIWKVAFKYPEELTQTFMSSNQIGGFFNRLEASRKYLFGSVGVLGTSNNSVIEGVFIARGKDIKPVVEVAPDWESYSFSPIDLNDAAQKAYFEGALAWDLDVDGKKWVDGKNFK